MRTAPRATTAPDIATIFPLSNSDSSTRDRGRGRGISVAGVVVFCPLFIQKEH